MGVNAGWADASQQIMICEVIAPWTWPEYRSTAEEMFDQIRLLNHPVATLIDVKRVGKLPPGNLLKELQYIEAILPANVFASVIVGAPYVVTSFMNILTRIRPKAKAIALYANSVDEAITMVQARREKLVQQSQSQS